MLPRSHSFHLQVALSRVEMDVPHLSSAPLGDQHCGDFFYDSSLGSGCLWHFQVLIKAQLTHGVLVTHFFLPGYFTVYQIYFDSTLYAVHSVELGKTHAKTVVQRIWLYEGYYWMVILMAV